MHVTVRGVEYRHTPAASQQTLRAEVSAQVQFSRQGGAKTENLAWLAIPGSDWEWTVAVSSGAIESRASRGLVASPALRSCGG